MRTLDSNDFVYEDETPSPSLTPSTVPLESTVSSTEPRVLSDFEIEEEPSLVKDLARLGVQGASMSFSDEALAGLQAAADVAGAEKTLKDFPALYEQYKQIERRKIEEAKERSPILGTAAELVGGIAPSLLTGGTSLAVKGAAKFLPSLARSTSTGAAIGRAALTGAQYGGVAAAGAMESPLLSSEGAAEIAKGATMGSLLGGALAGAGEAAKGIYTKYAPESRAFKLSGIAAKEALEGRPSPTSTIGEELLIKEEQEAARGFSERFFSKETTADGISTPAGIKELQGRKIGEVTKEAAERGLKVGHLPETRSNVDALRKILIEEPTLLNLSKKEEDLISSFIQESLKNKGLIPPDLANEVRRILPGIQQRLQDKIPLKKLEVISKLKTSLLNELENPENVPGFAQANRAYRSSMEVLDELIGKRISDVPRETRSGVVFDEVRDLIKKAEVLGETGVTARERINLLKQSAKKAFDLDPDTYKKVGINTPDELFTEIERQSGRASIRQGLGGVDRGPGKLGKLEALLNLVHPYQLGRYGGKVAKTASDISRWTYKQPDKVLLSLADNFEQYPNLRWASKSLRESIQSGNTRAKNNVLFHLLQQKEVRAILGEEAASEQGTE